MADSWIDANHRWLISGLNESITLAPLALEKRFTKIEDSDLGRQKNSWIAIEGGKILAAGSGAIPEVYHSFKKLDGSGCIALPGLIDAHTHPIFAGSRAAEFCMQLSGKTYQDIAAAGGGIQSTVKATLQASDEVLEALLQDRLKTFLSHGVTTIEAKSGYGLTVEQELRHLRLIKRVAEHSQLTISPTCLALHAVPREENSAKSWSDRCATELLPIVAKEGLADSVDAFIEAGYFSVEDCDPFFQAAERLGLQIRVHADEFSDAKAAGCAAHYRALSADHLQFASRDGIAAMAKAGVTALLLPGTSLYTSIPYTDARSFTQAGCAVGLATDFNPGSCPVDNLRMIVTLGARHCHLSPAEAVAAVTWVAAKSLNLHHRKGALIPGMDADLVVLPLNSLEEFIADLGRCKPRWVLSSVNN